MKKILAIILVLCLMLAITACSQELPSKANNNQSTADKVINNAPPNKLNKGEKPIVETNPTEELSTAPTELIEDVDMGVAGETIYLSELEENRTYLFHIENAPTLPEDESQEFSMLNVQPNLVNDTEYTVLNVIIQINDGEPENFTAFKHTAYTYVPLANAILDHKEVKTLRLTVQPVDVEEVLDPEQTINLSECDLNVDIDMGTKNYLFNNTESTITVKSDSVEYVLLPYDILESSFTYVNTIVNIDYNEGVG